MPKVIKQGGVVDKKPVALPEALSSDLLHAKTTKTLTTVDEKGIPHTVHKHSIKALDDGCLAYMEFLEGSQTSKNMLRNHWDKTLVSITTFNAESGNSFQIKGLAYKYVVQGPIWDDLLRLTWEMMPKVEPAGVWIIIPEEVRNEEYEKRFKEEDERLKPSHRQWFTYKDRSYSRRYGTP